MNKEHIEALSRVIELMKFQAESAFFSNEEKKEALHEAELFREIQVFIMSSINKKEKA